MAVVITLVSVRCYKSIEASGIKASYRLFAGPAVINAISDFTRTNSGATRFNQETTGGGSISLSVVEYKSDYGVIQVVPDLFLFRSISAPSTLVSNSALLIPNDDNVSLKVMDGVTAVDLPDIGGGGKRGYVSFAGTTCVLNAKALGSISLADKNLVSQLPFEGRSWGRPSFFFGLMAGKKVYITPCL